MVIGTRRYFILILRLSDMLLVYRNTDLNVFPSNIKKKKHRNKIKKNEISALFYQRCDAPMKSGLKSSQWYSLIYVRFLCNHLNILRFPKLLGAYFPWHFFTFAMRTHTPDKIQLILLLKFRKKHSLSHFLMYH